MAKTPSVIVPRRAVELSSGNGGQPQFLSDWRSAGAYVLLAEPGAGKTEAFKAEAKETGATFKTARDFITLRSQTFDTTRPIFIDGLDEIRAGSGSHRGPLDDIRARLDELGRPAFRLSCREADWRSAVDLEPLKAVAPEGKITELHLQELGEADILAILRALSVNRPDEFLAESERHGVRPLLANPLLLNLIVDAVGTHGSHWPDNRSAIYSLACARLAVEYNEEHRAERRGDQSIDRLLKDAALISALWLLAGIQGVSDEAGTDGAQAVLVNALPDSLGVGDARAALTSKLFVLDGVLRLPRHRTIAEFLAAGAIADRIANGLPVGRVLALMSGADGGIVDPLRGLHAWLATRCIPERPVFIERDPLGVVLYGDLKSFTTAEKKQVLNALHREAQRFAWFRKGHWEDHPFGALGTADMVDAFRDLLTAPDRSIAHQSLLGCVLDAIKHGEPMPSLGQDLRVLMRDPTFRPETRVEALEALLAQPSPDLADARSMLDEIESGSIPDPDDQLAGHLLEKLYPEIVTPKEIFRYFRAPKAESFFGQYQDFWRRQFIALTPREALIDVMDSWSGAIWEGAEDRYGLTRNHISGELLNAALAAIGDDVSIETLYSWLGVGIGKHGVSRLTEDDVKGARAWLSTRPSKLKALVAYGWTRIPIEGSSGRRYFWQSEQRTQGATRPSDWYEWLLDQAAATNDEALARYCFNAAAHAAINPRPDFEVTKEMVEDWVRLNRSKWPKAGEWLEEIWSPPLDVDNWQREESIRKRKYDAKREIDRQERCRNILPHLASIFTGAAPAGLMNQIALAFDKRYYDIHGDTPAERVQDFLGGTVEEAASAVKGLEATLLRSDLPAVKDIFKTDLAGRSHFIRPACLLGASLAFQRDPEATQNWPDSLVCKLAAFWLTEGLGESPGWFSAVAAQRPAVVAPVLEQYAVQSIRRRSVTNVTGLWQLAREESMADLARLVVPGLMRAFPTRANETQLRILSGELLPAATKHLSSGELSTILAERKALKSVDVPQRIAYLIAGLGFDGENCSHQLLALVGASESRAAHLGRALEWQGLRKKNAAPLPARVCGRLIELIAPYASPDRPTGAFWVGDADHRRDWVYHFINQLASAASPDASEEIARLSASRSLVRWKLTLEGAAFDQTRAMRDATFRQASVQEVADVLANKAPANSRDLAALFMDHLRDLELRLRGDDTNGLKLFRRDDGRTPKTENACRDILLNRMRSPLLALAVHLEKEAQATQDSRADMRAESVRPESRLTVPIEIKKDDHRELWSAWRTQLRSYALDPASEGVGIYLVLWFGIKPRATPEGLRPSTPQQLIDLLSAMIPAEDRCRLHVAVLDLSTSK